MSLAEELGVELQAAMAARPRASWRIDWRANWLAFAVCALLAAGIGLVATAAQVAGRMNDLVAEREARFARQALISQTLDIRDANAVRTFALHYDFHNPRIARSGERLAKGEIAVPVAGAEGASFVFRPRSLGSELFAQFAPTRIPFVLAALGVVGFLVVQYRRLARALDRERLSAAAQARREPLTGLVNRLGFQEAMRDRFACGESFSLICVDLNGFKKVNDTMGHGAGDEVLQAVARRVSAAVGEQDIVARLGGDEFAVLFHGEVGDILRQVKKVLLRISEPIGLSTGHTARITATAGVATAWVDGDRADVLMLAADDALYGAKRTGAGYCFAGMEIPAGQRAAI